LTTCTGSRYQAYGIDCYGGAMGLRAARAVTPILAALKVSLCSDVSIPLRTIPVVDGVFPSEALVALANATLDVACVVASLGRGLRVEELSDSSRPVQVFGARASLVHHSALLTKRVGDLAQVGGKSFGCEVANLLG
jgi:hypothetical protein